MDPSRSLLRLMEDLVESLDSRDAPGDPQAASGEAARRVQRLEVELTRRLRLAGSGAADPIDGRDEELVAIG